MAPRPQLRYDSPMLILYVKALHVAFMVTWFAALFYLPRLFVYHAMSTDAATIDKFKIMERKLAVMMDIGATLTMVFGFWLLFSYGWALYKHNGWLHVKLTLVALLVGYHVWCRLSCATSARPESALAPLVPRLQRGADAAA